MTITTDQIVAETIATTEKIATGVLMTTDQIAAGALITALVSLFIALKSHFLAKSAYKLSKKEHNDKYKNIYGYLLDRYKWERESEQYASFSVAYTNNATSSNSFIDIFLEIEYYDEGGICHKAKITPEARAFHSKLKEEYQDLELPVNFNPRETKSGWISFKLPKSDDKKLSIDTYHLCAITTSDKTVTLVSHFLTNFLTK